jgi:hypothetical protein
MSIRRLSGDGLDREFAFAAALDEGIARRERDARAMKDSWKPPG